MKFVRLLGCWLTLVLVPAMASPVRLTFDTDMGNDIDDALALAMIHALQNRGEAVLLAVTVTKDNRPRGTAEKRPMRDISKPANGIQAGQALLYRTEAPFGN